MTETVTIVSISGRLANVTCLESDSCKGCAGNSFCNAKGRSFEAKVPSELAQSLIPGDKAEVLIPPGKTIFAGFMVLIVPLLLFIAGFLLASILIPDSGEGTQAIMGIIGLGLGFLLAFAYNKLTGTKNLPIVVGKVTE
ncbi:SoxR reducing system RseC family protein [Sediminispirochaeta smaragdinae]|uniref:Positive regulator of sigma E, RseC/MucC n=1 Tax=Sediminispirochaeta smaragdinae (strain DSM 11293 / JCM 15392 / SEBR 4228) TaxID=573413 RepID=E1R9F2_SEDSS|nr:SoxR reducing system RseC family protein [Sediminispirochaeta smaragdinae]ADK83121.1 positive regulator of sigma E, RseC/MucC [Sediminispirochaeta smaragdinae DSM 11293]